MTTRASLPLLLVSFLLTLFLALACGDPSVTGPPAPGEEGPSIEEVIDSATPFTDVPARVQADSLDASSTFNQDVDSAQVTQRYFCTTRRVRISGGNPEFPLFNPNSSVIYPGNLLQGATLNDAPPRTIPLARGPGVISYNLINGNFSPSVSVDSVVLSEVRRAQNEIVAQSVAQNGPAVPANFTLSVEQVQSREELAFRLGASVRTLNVAASGNLSVATQSSRNTVLVTLRQAYYTMDVDVPTTTRGFFKEGITGQQLSRFVSADNPAAYISSVTYGRVFHMLFTSSSSASQMKARLNLAFRAFRAEAAASVEVGRISDLQELSVQVLAYGGSDRETFSAVADFTENESIRDFLRQIGQSSDIRTGLPISYVVNSVADPSRVLKVNLATEYDVTECELKGILPPAGYAALRDLFRTEDDPGGIGAVTQMWNDQLLVYNLRGDRYAWFNARLARVEGMWDHNDPNGPLGVSAFEGVGAAFRYGAERIYVFDKSGLSYQIYNYDGTLVRNGAPPSDAGAIGEYFKPDDRPDGVFPTIATLGSASPFPFDNDGIAAATNWRPQDFTPILWNGRGDRFAAHSFPNRNWGAVGNTRQLFSAGGVFDRITAIARFQLGNANSRYLIVNHKGEEIMEYDEARRLYSGPWVIN